MNHQYSDREALPEKVAYFCFRTVRTASVNPIEMPPFLLAASAVIDGLTIVLLDCLSDENSYNSNVEIAISRLHRLIILKAMINALRFSPR
ncbi:hypothetical protein GFM02_04820 [Rhizobium leguminosarum bv. viciae]|uniref:hypothetical protein n=1 Tax=Rhizobium leguminosarum TaxID=384 RepID=UPI0014429ECA|nr:hypothetical protein [Rhizobium leguminosarum]NKK97601.1 hypothetical protein [Rhizobium leguminosarum bv. viciae]